MPNTHSSKLILFTGMLLVAIIAIACSDDSPNEEVSEAGGSSFETCEGFISPEELEETSGITGLVDRVQTIDISSIPGLTESGATENCLIEVFRTLDGSDSPAPGDSISLSIVQFSSEQQALTLYNSTLASAIITAEQVGELAKIEQGIIGSDSYYMDVNTGGIGAIVVSVSGSSFISMSSTSDSEGNALLDVPQLISAVEGVQSRLP